MEVQIRKRACVRTVNGYGYWILLTMFWKPVYSFPVRSRANRAE